MEVLYFFVAVFGEVTYFSSPRMCLNLRALIFHRNIKKEGRHSAYRQTSFRVARKAKGVARTLE